MPKIKVLDRRIKSGGKQRDAGEGNIFIRKKGTLLRRPAGSPVTAEEKQTFDIEGLDTSGSEEEQVEVSRGELPDVQRDPTAQLSPSEAISVSETLAAGQTAPISIDREALRERAQGQVSPFFDILEEQLTQLEQTQRREAELARSKIERTFDDKLEELQEAYNRRGLLFSGQELGEEADLGAREAEKVSDVNIQLQKSLITLGEQRVELGLSEAQAIEEQFQNLVTSRRNLLETQQESQTQRAQAEILSEFLPGILQRKRQEAAIDRAQDELDIQLDLAEERREQAQERREQRGERREQTIFPFKLAKKQLDVERERRELPLDIELKKARIQKSRAQAAGENQVSDNVVQVLRGNAVADNLSRKDRAFVMSADGWRSFMQLNRISTTFEDYRQFILERNAQLKAEQQRQEQRFGVSSPTLVMPPVNADPEVWADAIRPTNIGQGDV